MSNKLSFSQFVIREKCKVNQVFDFFFGNNYDNNKDYYDWMLDNLKDEKN